MDLKSIHTLSQLMTGVKNLKSIVVTLVTRFFMV